jgi:prevent-host-death family protein
MARWQIDEARRHLTQLIETARTDGPQIITRYGAERAIVLSIEEFRTLTAHKPGLKEYLLSGPKVDDFEIEPDRDMGREIGL